MHKAVTTFKNKGGEGVKKLWDLFVRGTNNKKVMFVYYGLLVWFLMWYLVG